MTYSKIKYGIFSDKRNEKYRKEKRIETSPAKLRSWEKSG